MTGILGHWRKSPECRTDCIYSLVIITLKFFLLGLFFLCLVEVCSLNVECLQKC